MEDGGSFPDNNSIVGVPVKVRNAKRLVRLQLRDQNTGAISIEFLIGNYDFVESGEFEVFSSFAYWVKKTSPESQIALLSIFVDFIKRKRVAESIIVVPPTGALWELGMERKH